MWHRVFNMHMNFPPLIRGGFRHVQHVRPNRGPHKKGAPTRGPALSDKLHNLVALNSSYSIYSVLCALCQSLTKCRWWQHCHYACHVNSVGRYSYIREGPPHFLLNRALLRLNPALPLMSTLYIKYSQLRAHTSSRLKCTTNMYSVRMYMYIG